VDTAGLESGPERILPTRTGQRGGGGGQADTPTAWRGQEPHRMTRGGPIHTEPLQGPLGQRPVTVCGPCAAADVDQPPGPGNIGALQVGALWPAQPTGVNGTQAAPLA
jgi:hypothetical protein